MNVGRSVPAILGVWLVLTILTVSIFCITFDFLVPDEIELAQAKYVRMGDVRSVTFSPSVDGADPEQLIISYIDNCSKELLCQAYSFTADKIGDAFVRAKKRGVTVKVLLDEYTSGQMGGEKAKLLAAEIEVYTDGKHKISHNKIMIFDREYVLTGSYNFSHAASHANAENIVFLSGKKVVSAFTDNFNHHLSHSRRCQ